MTFSTVDKKAVAGPHVFCIWNTFGKKYFVFCIFRTNSKVFDKSISNTYFQKYFVFCIWTQKKSIFYNPGLFASVKLYTLYSTAMQWRMHYLLFSTWCVSSNNFTDLETGVEFTKFERRSYVGAISLSLFTRHMNILLFEYKAAAHMWLLFLCTVYNTLAYLLTYLWYKPRNR